MIDRTAAIGRYRAWPMSARDPKRTFAATSIRTFSAPTHKVSGRRKLACDCPLDCRVGLHHHALGAVCERICGACVGSRLAHLLLRLEAGGVHRLTPQRRVALDQGGKLGGSVAERINADLVQPLDDARFARGLDDFLREA